MKRLRIAILGAGFSGLSVAWHLLAKQTCEVIIYDPSGIGGGASGIATGLLHPYVGEQGRRSQLATEGLQAAKELIAAVEKQWNTKVIIGHGIIRYIQDEEQYQMFLSHGKEHGDVKLQDDGNFAIESGMTIDCPLYLEGLWQAIAEKGAKLIREKVTDLNALNGFDHRIVAAGAGIHQFPELSALRTSILKGQVLVCRAPDDIPLLPSSAIGKGYIALTHDPRTCFVGSTYEREYLTEAPNVELAKSLLFKKRAVFSLP